MVNENHRKSKLDSRKEDSYTIVMALKTIDFIANAILASIRAKFMPIQILRPPPKGKNAIGCFDAFEIPPENLPGLNSCASSPHNSGSSIGSASSTPGGIENFPSSILLCVCRIIFPPEYNLIASYRIIGTCGARNNRTIQHVELFKFNNICKNHGQCNFSFHQSKVLANTNPRPPAEREERHLML
ncbi:hypothetical protein CKAN_02552900 [Cinnamomum micranthum f. kanehirae]|uniref:Uncharacterized protein n=1 Tax=Cinnamomum micranthum f. kanehirae TaxID=337451 RepID=A0A3S3R8N5_9MAGN|nr:hypothetical protein CKAN_02552900 [Cinnamomum micranthum f. kanehirae]